MVTCGYPDVAAAVPSITSLLQSWPRRSGYASSWITHFVWAWNNDTEMIKRLRIRFCKTNPIPYIKNLTYIGTATARIPLRPLPREGLERIVPCLSFLLVNPPASVSDAISLWCEALLLWVNRCHRRQHWCSDEWKLHLVWYNATSFTNRNL